MGILQSLYTGVSGLTAQGDALGIYGDNIANASTTGFKASRPEFEDVISKSLKGLLGGNQIGRGVKLAAVNPIFSQGSVLQTESGTDLAIVGDGFFTLRGPDGQSYTRDGAFHFDKDGKLINADNFKVMGFVADENGMVSSKLDAISLERTIIDAKKTSEVKFNANLDLRADKSKIFDVKDPDKTSHFATGVTVYDSAGTDHTATVYFNRTEDGIWSWHALVKGEETVGGVKNTPVEAARGRLTFGPDGKLRDQQTELSSFNFNKGALPNQSIKFNFGEDVLHGGAGTQVTQYGSTSEAYRTSQDGYTTGTLSGLTFSDDGMLTAIYTNGENVNVAQVAIGRFENVEGLFKQGQNRFRESRLSGEPTIGSPGTGGRGQIAAKSLESSNTDIATEFINLMQAQRGFQANTKVVSAADEMLQEILNLRRS